MPIPSTQQSTMNTINGNLPILDTNGILQSLAYTPRFVSKVAAYTCTAKESGTFFNTTGATTAITFTLPAISDGPWVFKFINSVDLAMTVAASTADTAIVFNDVAADSLALSTSGEIIGGIINAYCDGTSLWMSAEGSNEATTITIATN